MARERRGVRLLLPRSRYEPRPGTHRCPGLRVLRPHPTHRVHLRFVLDRRRSRLARQGLRPPAPRDRRTRRAPPERHPATDRNLVTGIVRLDDPLLRSRRLRARRARAQLLPRRRRQTHLRQIPHRHAVVYCIQNRDGAGTRAVARSLRVRARVRHLRSSGKRTQRTNRTKHGPARLLRKRRLREKRKVTVVNNTRGGSNLAPERCVPLSRTVRALAGLSALCPFPDERRCRRLALPKLRRGLLNRRRDPPLGEKPLQQVAALFA